MGDILGSVTKEKVNIFLNTDKVIGLQNLNVQNGLPLKAPVFLGMRTSNFPAFQDGQPSTSVSFDRLLLNNEPFYNFATGNQLFSVFWLQNPSDINNDCYSLCSGYITSYSCKYSTNQIPQVSVEASFIDKVGNLATGVLKSADVNMLKVIQTGNFTGDSSVLVPYGNSIILNLNDFSTNRIVSFDLSLNINRVPVYNMGMGINRVEYIPPIEVNASFSFELGKYQFKDLKDFPRSGNVDNITLNINSYDSNIPITSYTFTNLTQSDENISISTDNNVKVDVAYRGILNP